MMLDDALELAALGWQVLPLNGKIPRTGHGCDDATTDTTVISRWWSRWPQANIGARVPDALLVLDVDPRNGGTEGWSSLTAGRAVPDTLTVFSGRGDGGRHYYFLRPAGPITAARVPKGIDVKRSGYMVMPPSLHPVTGRPYVWHDVDPVPLPAWLREVLRPAPPKTRTVFSGTPTEGRGLVEFVARQENGNRNNALFWAARRAVESGVLDTIEPDLIAAALATGQDRRTVERTVASARKKASS
jgi:hypothetical protein